MQARQHVPAVADAAMNECHVVERIERRLKGIAGQRSDLGFDGKLADPLDQFLARLAKGDQVGDGDALQLVALGERGDVRLRA